MTIKNNATVPTPSNDVVETSDIEPAVPPQKKPRIDLSAVRLPQDFASMAQIEQVLTSCPVRKPNKQEFIRTHDSAEERIEVHMLELKEEREMYLVDPSLAVELSMEIKPYRLYRTINRQGTEFLWPVRLPDLDGKSMSWWDSAAQAAELAMTDWVRVSADMNLGAYRIAKAATELSAPVWTSSTFQELVEVAFEKAYIDTPDHAVVQRLRGLI